MTPAEQMREAAAIARIADRIERQAKAVAAYSLFETPRKIPNFPTTVEVSLSYFTDIANELRAIPTEATEPSSELLTAAYLSGAYDWRKKAERMNDRMKFATEMLKSAAEVAGDIPANWDDTRQIVTACGHFRCVHAALAAIREALGET